MSRGIGKLGYGGGAPPVEVLNEAYPFAQVYIGAGAFTQALLEPALFVPAFQIGSGANDSEDAWNFAEDEKNEIYARWSFADLPIDLADPEFKIFPEFKQTFDTLKPSPAEFALFEYGIGVNTDITDSNYTMIDIPALSEVEAELVSFAVGSNVANKAVAVNTISGTGLPLSQTNKSNIRFSVARTPLDASDTFAHDVFFMGMAVQFKTDFANVAEWAV